MKVLARVSFLLLENCSTVCCTIYFKYSVKMTKIYFVYPLYMYQETPKNLTDFCIVTLNLTC